MYNEARRLGTEKGGKLLLAVDDTALQLLDATRSMVIAGIPVDLNRLHGKEARPEFFGMAAPAYHKQADAPDVVVPIETDKKGFAIGARNED